MTITSVPVTLLDEAIDFLYTSYREMGKSESQLIERMAEVGKQIEETGTYKHTAEELEHGARMAWRNNNRCIGRLFWNSLTIIDERHQRTAEGAFEALLHHIEFATNGGKIRPAITVFPAAVEGAERDADLEPSADPLCRI